MTLKIKENQEIKKGDQEAEEAEEKKKRIQPGANSTLRLADDTQPSSKMKEVSKL